MVMIVHRRLANFLLCHRFSASSSTQFASGECGDRDSDCVRLLSTRPQQDVTPSVPERHSGTQCGGVQLLSYRPLENRGNASDPEEHQRAGGVHLRTRTPDDPLYPPPERGAVSLLSYRRLDVLDAPEQGASQNVLESVEEGDRWSRPDQDASHVAVQESVEEEDPFAPPSYGSLYLEAPPPYTKDSFPAHVPPQECAPPSYSESCLYTSTHSQLQLHHADRTTQPEHQQPQHHYHLQSHRQGQRRQSQYQLPSASTASTPPTTYASLPPGELVNLVTQSTWF
ncbi:uncharacterized protein LOC134463374 [Engraulis encrasicolus]|uniref:uncharacterized protein LOC134463374 n=1 Tax=Engraulis encrasicolus TaxID=184585 RepID=UPI002FD42B99